MSRRERRHLRRKGKKHQPEQNKEGEQREQKPDENEEVKGWKVKLLHMYDKEYKKILIVPFAIFLLSIIIIIGTVATTGDFINKGVSLKGGITVTVFTDIVVDIDGFQNSLQDKFSGTDVEVRRISKAGMTVGFILDASDVTEEDLLTAVEAQVGPLDDIEYSVEETGSTLGESFFRETIIALLIAFVFMGVVVMLYFKSFVPSIAVILAALSDMLGTIAVTDILGIRISTAGIAAFLMLIGYSVDTDILLSTRVLKRQEGTVQSRVLDAMKTGMTMTGTTLVAILVVLLFTQSEVLKQIMTILLIGLILDLINTWLQNVGILKWFIEHHPDKVQRIKKE
ncbi:MAG: hypothetical protein ACE5DM_02150 [Candidatus Nanoarchaeia archaeon]